jgi:DNA-binding LacI/PurR family transcriptional regulator
MEEAAPTARKTRKKNNITAIALALGVSTATVSRVLNNKPDVNPATRDRVLSYLKGLDMQPKGPSDAGFRMIGIVNDYDRYPVTSHYVSGIVDRVTASLTRNGFYPVLIPSSIVDKEIRWPSQYGIFRQVSGLVWSMPIFSEKYRAFVDDAGLPCVVVNNLAEGVRARLVQSDNITSARQAVEYLYAMGHRKIGFIGGSLDLLNIKDRYESFRSTMTAHGLPVERGWVVDDIQSLTPEGAKAAAIRLLGRGELPTALLCCNDNVAIAVYYACAERGIRIPEQLSVISFDDNPESRFLDPPLTTFRQPFRELGDAAVETILHLLEKRGEPAAATRTDVGMSLVVRSSVTGVCEPA